MLRKLILLFLAVHGCLTNLIAQNTNSQASPIKVNSIVNSDYDKSTELTTGRLDSLDIINFHKALRHNLKVTTNPTQTLIIGYMQNGLNCIAIEGSDKYLKTVQEKYLKSTKKIAKKYDAKNLLIYESGSFLSAYPCTECIEDTSFVKRFVFTSNKNCMGFFILKVNGQFYKYYGEDYVSIINDLLSGKLNN